MSGDRYDVFTDGFGDLTRGVDALGVSVNDDLGEHLGVIAIPPSPGVSRVKDGVIEPIHGGVHQANQVIRGNVLF